ncbi:MAG: DUF4329 domain-containing protein [Victivallaceae bacterium]
MMKKLCLAATLLLGLIGALSLSAAPSKQIMSLEYFYAKDGTITGRSVNGRMQTYQYDKRGQLLAVVDGKGQAVEKYVYDRAGNILEKTVNGVTTAYTYDKANQLVSSTVEGNVTSYRYDAAGRLVKEGDKSYRYGYLDKVLAVYENDENTANFDYHLDGQVASATRNGETENFTWDGLALIHRGSSTFINEPYVTGGNPLLNSKGGVMFNDMLGSTLGVYGKQGVDAISMTAFGETENKSAFFTGKPAVGELGFAFLFRNYRAEQGKWQTADPLGYPDGWNSLAYCNNRVLLYFDRYGLAVGDIYDSMDKAATAWGNEFNGKSISDNKEYGSTLYQNGDGYSYSNPNIGTQSGVHPSSPPDGQTVVADIHSHGAYSPYYNNDAFAQGDMADNDKENISGYLTTPNGSLQKYDPTKPEGERTTQISDSMPYDPNHPKPLKPKVQE